MKLVRRQFLQIAGAAVAAPMLAKSAWALDYPTRPGRIVVGFPAGGSVDILARFAGQWLSERLGKPFIVENRPGAAANIATDVVTKAAPDGYTLLLFSSSAFTNMALYDNLSFNFARDIVPVASIAKGALAMVVNPSFPAKDVPEFIAYAKANPGKVNMASAGIGGVPHVSGELFKSMADIDMVHIPYGGDVAALTDLVGGRVQVYFSPLSGSIEYITSGKLRALAVTTEKRSDALPDVATVGEFLPGYEASLWNGLGAPKDTPAEIIDKINGQINAALADPKIKAQLAGLGSVAVPMTSAEFGKLIAAETEKWGKVIRAADIKV